MLPFLIFSFAVWVVQSQGQDSGSGGDSGGNAPTTKTPAVTDGKSP